MISQRPTPPRGFQVSHDLLVENALTQPAHPMARTDEAVRGNLSPRLHQVNAEAGDRHSLSHFDISRPKTLHQRR
jgi:hypothetical protein